MSMPPRHSYLRYNQYGVLRPNPLFWASLLYLCRHALLLVLLAAAGRTGQGRDLAYLAGLVEPLYLIADVPAMVLLAALAARTPKAGRAVRWIWERGRIWLLTSTGLYAALVFWRHADEDLDPWLWVSLCVVGLIAGYGLRSRYLGELFAQFPEAEEKTERD